MLAFRSLILLALLIGSVLGQPAEKKGDGGKKEVNPLSAIAWVEGPAKGALRDEASIEIPKGFVFADAEGTKKFLEISQNIPSGNEYGMLAPKDFDWFAIYKYNASGYIKDDEKTNLDADAIMESLRKGNEGSNEERKRRGWETMEIVRWTQKPHFDDVTKNLEWATEARSETGGVSMNHNTRVLGRNGYMSVILVGDVQGYASQLAVFRKSMTGFQYVPDKQYSAFRSGDKVAEYGLTALIVGGTAAVASKTGLLKGLWKLIVLAVAGVGAFLKSLFTRKEPEAVNGEDDVVSE